MDINFQNIIYLQVTLKVTYSVTVLRARARIQDLGIFRGSQSRYKSLYIESCLTNLGGYKPELEPGSVKIPKKGYQKLEGEDNFRDPSNYNKNIRILRTWHVCQIQLFEKFASILLNLFYYHSTFSGFTTTSQKVTVAKSNLGHFSY